jgi:hypothetical protein
MSTHLNWLDDDIQSLKDWGTTTASDHQFTAGAATDDRRKVGAKFCSNNYGPGDHRGWWRRQGSYGKVRRRPGRGADDLGTTESHRTRNDWRFKGADEVITFRPVLRPTWGQWRIGGQRGQSFRPATTPDHRRPPAFGRKHRAV